ncbi:MAG: sulfite exporter TauE/SafE family protein, partial [Candidatus Omnitrophota bacterium]
IFLGKFLKANGLDYNAISQKYGWDKNTTFEQKVDNIISEIPFGSIFGLEFTLVRNMDGQISFVTKTSLKDYLMNAAIDIKFSEEISLNNMTRAALEKIFDMVIAGSDDPTGTITFEIIAGQAKVKEQHETLLVLTIGSNGERCYVVNETRVTNYYNAITGELEKTVTDFRRNGKTVENLYDINQFMADMGWDPIAVMEYYNSHKGEGNKLTNESSETMWLQALVMYAFKDSGNKGMDSVIVKIKTKDGTVKEYQLTRDQLISVLWGGKAKLSNDITLEAFTSEVTINLNEQTITERTDSKYSNGQLISYDEKIWSSATPSIWTYYEHRNIKYKLVTLANGVTVWKIKSQDITSYKIGAEYTPEAWAQLSDEEKANALARSAIANGRTFEYKVLGFNLWDSLSYENKLKVAAEWFKKNTDLSEIPTINTSDDPTVIYQEDLEYDEFGRLIGYAEMITEGTLVTINKVSNITYNEYGQIIARKTETWKNDTASSPETRGEGRSRLRNTGTGRGNTADVSAESPLNQHYITYEGVYGEDATGNLILEKDGKDYRMKYNAFGQLVYSYSAVSTQKYVDGNWVWEGVGDDIHLHPVAYFSEKTFFYNESGNVSGYIEHGVDPEGRLPYFNVVTYKYNSAGEVIWSHTTGYRYDFENPGYTYENGNIIDIFTTSEEWLLENCTIGESDGTGKRAVYYQGEFLGYVYEDGFGNGDDYVTFETVIGTYEEGTEKMTKVWFDTVQIDMAYNSHMKLAAFREGGTVNGYWYYFQRWSITYNGAGQITGYYQIGDGAQGGSGSSLKDLREQSGKHHDLAWKEFKYDVNGDVIGTSGWYINDDGDRVDQSATIKIERDKTTGVIVKITTVSSWETDDAYGGQTDTTTFSYDKNGIRVGQAEATSNKWDEQKWTLGRILTILAVAIAGIVTGILTAGTTSPLLASILVSVMSVSAAVTIATIVVVAFFVALATTLTSYLANSIRFGFDKASWDMFLQDFLKSWGISILAQGVGYGLGETMDWIGGAGEATAEAATVTIGDMIVKGLLTASVTTLILWAINGFDKNFFKDLNFGQVFIIALATILSVSTNVIEQTMEVLKDIYNSTLGAIKDALGLNENLVGAWQAGKLSFFGLLEKAFYRAVFQTLEDYAVDRLTREPGGSGTSLVFSMIWNYQGDQKGWYETKSGEFVFMQTTPLLGSMAFLRSAGILIITSLGNLFEKLNENKGEPRKSDWRIRLFRNLASESFEAAFNRIGFGDSVDENLGTMVSSGYITDNESGEKLFARVYVKEDKETGAKNKTVIITSSKESQDIKEYRTSGTEGGKEKYAAHTQSNLKNMILYVLNTLGVDQEKMIALNGEDLEISTSSISS